MTAPFPIRKERPPGGARTCQREALLADPQADLRILRLAGEEEKNLLNLLESLQTLPELHRMVEGLQTRLGIVLTMAPGFTEVQSVRGFQIQVREQLGLWRKTRQAIPAAVRRCLKATPMVCWKGLRMCLTRQFLGPKRRPKKTRSRRASCQRQTAFTWTTSGVSLQVRPVLRRTIAANRVPALGTSR